HGSKAKSLELRVPLGTLVRNAEDNSLIADILHHGQKVVVAKGGRGGRGNARFATSKQKAPQIAERGEPGQELWLTLELKLLADVGLIGMPNAGKSTFISKVSAAKPKIADYPFTTLTPNLGMVDMGEGESFIIADLPGLVEGAAGGTGLGHRFLRHVERTKVMVHVVDMSEREDRDPYEDFICINKELALYRDDLGQRTQIIAANKMDYPGAEEQLAIFREKIKDQYEIFPISAINGEGLQPLLWRLVALLAEAPEINQPIEEEIRRTIIRDEEPWHIARDIDGSWLITGTEIEKLTLMTNLDSGDALARFQRIFVKMGLEEALKKAGIKEGDTVHIGREEFEYSE
ncbi:MAG: GTPase ObgE, partial [Clostridiales bacterium]